MAQKGIVYPNGVRELSDDLTTDELVRRLKECAQAFQNMSQDDDNSKYIPLAEYLVSETFLEHPSRDVRLLVACCIADVFRVFAPDAPYKDAEQLKVIFEFFVDQLRGLEDPSKPSFKSHFYLLENFSCVKTFNICVELEDTQKILCRLFSLMFRIINENHSAKVKKFILDMLSPLISEADVVSQELLDVILRQIIEPGKSKNRNACSLAQDILKRNITALEPYIQNFFNNALILGKTLESDLACHLYELIYELNGICPSMLTVVLPQLEFKIKSNEEKERIDVTKVLGRMFSDKNSTMIEENKTLWNSFLSRFNDISPQVRICCVQFCISFLLNHPEARSDITDQLKLRHRDVDENVRYEVVVTIVNTAKEDFSCINEELLSFVKERTLDKKFKIRKEALLGLANVYKKLMSSNAPKAEIESISWIKNKVLHAYYQTSLEDRLLVERILHTCLVPYLTPIEERMKLLYQLFCSVDDYAVKSFKEIMKCQSVLRSQVKNLLELVQSEKNDARQKNLATKISVLSKNLQDPAKSHEYIVRFCNDLESNLRLRSAMGTVLNGHTSCSEVEQKVKEVLKYVGETKTNTYFMIIKQLLERIAPLMIDKVGIKYLVQYVKDSLLGDCAIEAELGLQNSSRRGLELLWVLTFVYPSAFHDNEIYQTLLLFLNVDDEIAADVTLQIFMNISSDIELHFPQVCTKILPILETFVETGTAKQAKHAVYCINSIVSDKEVVFKSIIDNLKKHLTLQSQYFRTALVSIGHIAYLCHDMFAADLKNIVAQIVVKDLLMLDQDLPRGGDDTWGPLDSLPDETKVKIEGMKVMVRWLLGLKDMVQPAISTLRLLTTVILHDGDLMERQHTAPIENSWMRLSAANCMLKLCQEPNYAEAITLEQFQILANMINDKCTEVRDRFLQKVHKGLMSLKLPLEFLSIFSLAALDEREDFHKQAKSCLISNINKRKEYIKHRVLTGEKLRQFLPDYAMPYVVHLLAHSPVLKSYNDVPSLKKIKECLWFLMEPLMIKNENYSFSFFKRLLENIKQTKDKQAQDDPEANMKLYAVCDLALSIVMSKTTNFILKDFPVEPALPDKLYTSPDPGYNNLKTYLPPELIPDKSIQKSGIGIEIFEATKPLEASQVNTPETTEVDMDVSQREDIVPDISLKEKESTAKTVSAVRTTRTKTKTRKRINKDLVNSEIPSDSDKADSNESPNSTNTAESLRNNDTMQEPSSSMNVNNTEQTNIKNVEVKLRPLRSSRLRSTGSTKSTKSNDSTPLEKQNGILANEMDNMEKWKMKHPFCNSDIQNSLKECNVSLRKDEVEEYIALNNSNNDRLDENCIDDDSQPTSLRHKNKSDVTDTSVPSKKRKRDDSPINSPVKIKSSSRLAEKTSNSSQSSKSKAVLKTNSSQSFPKSNNSLKKGNKLSIVNGSHTGKVLQKDSNSQKNQKSNNQSPVKRSLRNQGKLNLRKR